MCCQNCFNDNWIKDLIGRRTAISSVCPRCLSVDVHVIDPIDLKVEFEQILVFYVPRTKGILLSRLLNQDWGIFKLSHANANALLFEILGACAKLKYKPKNITTLTLATRKWESLRTELKSTNRFFPVNAPNEVEFNKLLINLVDRKLPTLLYRARNNKGIENFKLQGLMAPSAQLVSDGRANPVGIPYLYLASTIETAICEVRPSKMDYVSVAKFVPKKEDLLIIDLSDPKNRISPFDLINAEIADIHSAMALLCVLGEELSTPLQSHRLSVDYLASQYLCELIKKLKYDGVCYKSSQADGINYAFFDVNAYSPYGKVLKYQVNDTNIKFKKVTA